MGRDRETSIHRGKRLRQLGEKQVELFEALASADAERVSRAREELERLGLLYGLTRRGPGGRPT
jgi:hypothetical protein